MSTPPIDLRLLLLEDDPNDAQIILRALRAAGYAPAYTRVQTEAEYAAALEPELDLILADFVVPGFGGLQALQCLQTLGYDVPFIIVSGQVEEEVAVAAVRQGAADYLLKDRLTRLGPAVASALEQRRLRQVARRTERRFRALIEHSTDGIALVDAQDRMLYLSPSVSLLVGYPASAMIGEWALGLVHSDDRAGVAQHLAAVRQAPGNVGHTEFRVRHADGSLRWMDAAANNALDEPDVGAIVINYRDVTERKQAEETQRRRAAELEALTQLSSELRAARTSAEMLPIFLRHATEVVGGGLGGLYLIEPSTGDLVARGWYPPNAGLLNLRHPSGQGITGHVAATGEVYVANDFAADPVVSMLPAEEESAWGAVRCSLSLPLRTQATTIGVLHVGRHEARPFAPHEIRLLTAIAEMAGNALHRAALFERTEQHLRRLTALHAVEAAISASLDLRLTLDVLLDQVKSQLEVDAAAVLLLNHPLQVLEHSAGRGFHSRAVERTRLRLGQGHAGRVARDRQALGLTSLNETPDEPARARLLAGEGFVGYYAVPLLAKGQTKGVLEVFHRAPLQPDADWVDFLSTLAEQAAIAIENAELFNNLERSNAELVLAYDTTLEGWSRALDLRDKETEGHTQRVTEMTLRLGRAQGLTDEALIHLRRGALLHDIGKMAIPDAILYKPGPLNDDEWVTMRRHPEYAHGLLAPITFLHSALDIPYSHHEKWDGSGYPRGLQGEQIPLAARLFAVADVWDALRSDRPYRPAWPHAQTLAHIQALSGSHFDPRVVALFVQMLDKLVD